MRTARAPHVRCMRAACALHAHRMRTARARMRTACALHARRMCTARVPHAHCMRTACALHVHLRAHCMKKNIEAYISKIDAQSRPDASTGADESVGGWPHLGENLARGPPQAAVGCPKKCKAKYRAVHF